MINRRSFRGLAICTCIFLGGSIAAQPRSTETLARDDTWLESIATHVRETSARLARASAAVSAASATTGACAASAASGASIASAKASQVRPAAPKAAAAKGAASTASSPSCNCIVAKVPEIENVTTRVPAWDAAALPALKQLVLREKLSVLPTVDVNVVFDEARVTVSSGWLDTTESLVRAEKLSSSLHAGACYRAYLHHVAQVMRFDADDLVKRGLTPPRSAPHFDTFAEIAESACRPLLSHTWASPPLDVRAEVEAGLVWWIGRELSLRQPASPLGAGERADKLMFALNLPEPGLTVIKALCQSSANGEYLTKGTCPAPESR